MLRYVRAVPGEPVAEPGDVICGPDGLGVVVTGVCSKPKMMLMRLIELANTMTRGWIFDGESLFARPTLRGDGVDYGTGLVGLDSETVPPWMRVSGLPTNHANKSVERMLHNRGSLRFTSMDLALAFVNMSLLASPGNRCGIHYPSVGGVARVIRCEPAVLMLDKGMWPAYELECEGVEVVAGEARKPSRSMFRSGYAVSLFEGTNMRVGLLS